MSVLDRERVTVHVLKRAGAFEMRRQACFLPCWSRRLSSPVPRPQRNLTPVTEFTAGANGAGSVHQLTNGSGADLYDFCAQANCADGANPTNIINTPWGWYGFTANGGTKGYGTIFMLTPSQDQTAPWTETVIYNFCSAKNCVDGANPTSSLWIDGNWIIGSTANQGAAGRGTLIEFNPTSGMIFFGTL